MSEIEDIASKHLGRTSDGKTMTRYETPDAIDSSLLVGVPRQLNREQYNIKKDKLPFIGFDQWNCYEFSHLLHNGLPYSGIMQIQYPDFTPNIVESKSLKLYLNSFNLARLNTGTAPTYERNGTAHEAIGIIKKDLSKVLDISPENVIVKISNNSFNWSTPKDYLINDGLNIDTILGVDDPDLNFNTYNEDPSLLDVVEDGLYHEQKLFSHNLRSNCRVTNQPDWGSVVVIYSGRKTVTPISLLKYITSMRNENHFHEEICECIYTRLHDALSPTRLLVACLYTRRGGIDINPVRYSDDSFNNLLGNMNNIASLPRTNRQ